VPRLTQVAGFLLVGIGALSFAGSGMASLLAAFPALFGFPLVIYGDAAKQPERRARALATSLGVGVAAFVLSLPMGARAFAPRGPLEPWPPGAFAGLLMAIVSGGYVVAAVVHRLRR
jgi:ABC-type spermidine/putrescine transport system permease subunit II